MEAPMEFWGVEVKVGQSVEVDPFDSFPGYIHISQVALGEAKKEKGAEPVILYLKVEDKKFVLGTLSRDDIPQLSLDLVLNDKSELSHNSKTASVYFCGYKVLTDDDNASDFSESDDDLALAEQEIGKHEIKTEDAKVSKPAKPVAAAAKPVAAAGPSAKQVKIVDPKKVKEDESDQSSEDVSGYEDDLISSDGSGSEEESESDEETPVKKVDQGKKRPNESASKTPVSTKKPKNATPEKTDGKKNVHTATPHPMKKGGKTPNSFGKDKSPNSGGQHSAKSGGNNSAKSGGNKSFSKGGGQQNRKGKWAK